MSESLFTFAILTVSTLITTDVVRPLMRTKSRLNIEFLARHFSRLNENPLTAFTGGYRARKARTLHYAIVRRVVARCFSFFHPSFPTLSSLFLPFVLPPFLFSPTISLSLFFHDQKIVGRALTALKVRRESRPKVTLQKSCNLRRKILYAYNHLSVFLIFQFFRG